MVQQQKMENILLVDDDHVQVRLIESILAQQGYKIIVAKDAADGLQKAMDGSPDLIILDVMMPIINGYNFCKLLKEQEHRKHIPIILVTARDEEEDIEIGMQMGAEAYLTKPINTEKLLKTISVIKSMNG